MQFVKTLPWWWWLRRNVRTCLQIGNYREMKSFVGHYLLYRFPPLFLIVSSTILHPLMFTNSYAYTHTQKCIYIYNYVLVFPWALWLPEKAFDSISVGLIYRKYYTKLLEYRNNNIWLIIKITRGKQSRN